MPNEGLADWPAATRVIDVWCRKRIMAGMITGGVGQAVASPTDVVKVRLQVGFHVRSVTWMGDSWFVTRASIVTIEDIAANPPRSSTTTAG